MIYDSFTADAPIKHTGFIDLSGILKLPEHVVAQRDLEEDMQTTSLWVTYTISQR